MIKLSLKNKNEPYECPYCLKPVGYIGRFIAMIVGTNFHNCDFSNVDFEKDEDITNITKDNM